MTKYELLFYIGAILGIGLIVNLTCSSKNYWEWYLSHFPNATDIPAAPSGWTPPVTLNDLYLVVVIMITALVLYFFMRKLEEAQK